MNSLTALAPLLAVVAGALVVLLLEVFIKKPERDYLGYVSVVFLGGASYLAVSSWNKGLSYFRGGLSLDNLAIFLTIFFGLAVAFVILLSLKYIGRQDANHGEIFALLLLALSGLMIMTSSPDLLVIFLGLEVLSVSSYALAGLRRNDEKSGEAALKYFLLGSFASAFLVLGLAFLYGAARSVAIPEVIAFFRGGSEPSVLGLVGIGLVVIGFGFKIAVVPFHMWTPDVYEGAPTPVTAFFSVGPKAAGFIVLLRLLLDFWETAGDRTALFWALWVISVLTMIIGNLIALRQTNVKRILAYSSIAHAGYIMVAVLARDNAGLVFYLTAYLFMNIGAFAAVIGLSKTGREYLELEDYAGVGFRYPWIGATLSIFLLSLAGFPPTAGFLAKFYIFSSAVRTDLVPLVIIGVLASLVSVFYYLRIVVYMYMREPVHRIEVDVENPALFLVLFLCLYGVLQLGIFPGNILLVIKQAVASLPF
ncbi:MAG: NADH-quinone oxidoreductase subunit N [Candidatus Aminicenantes bacterium]|nr:NADH-quinone oxidoreductase subunit N [Candidatus Aminicenantes bacterium]